MKLLEKRKFDFKVDNVSISVSIFGCHQPCFTIHVVQLIIKLGSYEHTTWQARKGLWLEH